MLAEAENLAKKAGDGREFAREETRVELLLWLGRADAASKAAARPRGTAPSVPGATTSERAS